MLLLPSPNLPSDSFSLSYSFYLLSSSLSIYYNRQAVEWGEGDQKGREEGRDSACSCLCAQSYLPVSLTLSNRHALSPALPRISRFCSSLNHSLVSDHPPTHVESSESIDRAGVRRTGNGEERLMRSKPRAEYR